MRGNIRRSPWSVRAMSPEANSLAVRLDLQVIADSPKGPFLVRHRGLEQELRGGDVNALVLKAAKELTDAD